MTAFLALLTFAVVFPIAWVGVLRLLAHAGGWSQLAQRYRDDGARDATAEASYRWQSGGVGWVSYNSCLWMDVCDSGLRLGVPLPFRIGHPTLFIPWSEFRGMKQRRILWKEFIEGDVGAPTVARIRLPRCIWG